MLFFPNALLIRPLYSFSAVLSPITYQDSSTPTHMSHIIIDCSHDVTPHSSYCHTYSNNDKVLDKR